MATPTIKNFLSQQFRQLCPSFPMDLTNIIYTYLPLYKFVDYIIINELYILKLQNFRLQWLDKVMLKEYPLALLTILSKYFSDDYIVDYFCNDNEKFIPFIRELDKISLTSRSESQIRILREEYFRLCFNLYSTSKIAYFSSSGLQKIDDIIRRDRPTKENIATKKYQGIDVLKGQRFFRNTKTVYEMIDYFINGLK